MKNCFYFILKALFVLKIFKFCPESFAHVRKRLDKKVKINFKTYDFTNCEKNDCNPHITQYFKSQQAIRQ